MDLKELVARYYELLRGGASDKELARIESQIFALAPSNVPRSGNGRLKWASGVLGQSQHGIARRRDLWLCGEAAEPLWERIASGMPLGRSQRVLMAARKRASKRNLVAFRRAIEEELDRLDFRAPADKPAASPAAEVIQPPLPAPTTSPREFWQRIRQVVAEHVRPKMELMPEHERERLLDDFDRDLQAVCAQHAAKWQKAARSLQDQRRVSRQRFINALRALHMDPPRRNAPLEPVLVQANKQKRTLARLYHPDSHGGSEHTRAQYQAVLDAFLVIEQYVSENKKSVRPSLRVVSGGK